MKEKRYKRFLVFAYGENPDGGMQDVAADFADRQLAESYAQECFRFQPYVELLDCHTGLVESFTE
jgi:hypothetical protein